MTINSEHPPQLQELAGPWACEENSLRALARKWATGEVGPAFAARGKGAAGARSQGLPAGVAVLPLVGVILPRNDWYGTSAQGFTGIVRGLITDERVSAVVLDVHSPGGMVYGVPEAASAVRDLAAVKPVVAVANSLAASAAYWIASQARVVVGVPSSDVGSIGVYLVHTDVSEANRRSGVKVSVIKAGENKAVGNPFEPLTDGGRASLQQSVDDLYDLFVGDVAKGRRTSAAAVRSGYGQGLSLGLHRALAARLLDRAGTLEQEIARLVGGTEQPSTAGRSRAARDTIVRQRALLDLLEGC